MEQYKDCSQKVKVLTNEEFLICCEEHMMWLQNLPIIEVPILFKDRELGTSKMSGSIIKEAVLGVISMKIDSLKNRYFLKRKRLA